MTPCYGANADPPEEAAAHAGGVVDVAGHEPGGDGAALAAARPVHKVVDELACGWRGKGDLQGWFLDARACAWVQVCRGDLHAH